MRWILWQIENANQISVIIALRRFKKNGDYKKIQKCLANTAGDIGVGEMPRQQIVEMENDR